MKVTVPQTDYLLGLADLTGKETRLASVNLILMLV